MLVLSRKVSEEIIIGDTIRVVVLKVGRGRVKLGFTAPSDVSIHREEISQTPCKKATPRATHVSQHDCCRTTQKE